MFDLPSAQTDSQASADRLRRLISLLLVAVFVGLVVVRTATMWNRHNEILLEHRERVEGMAHILGAHLAQKIDTMDTALAQIALHSERVGGPNAHPPAWDPVLRAAFAGLKGAGSLSIVNDAGIIAHSTIDAIVGQSRSDQFIYRHLKENPNVQFVADKPFPSPSGLGMLIPLGRRLATPDGRFDGVAVVTLVPEQLRDFYRSVNTGADGRISVLHPQGVTLFSEPSTINPTGQPVNTNPLFQAALTKDRGFLIAPFEPSGQSYVSAYQNIPKVNLILTVSVNQKRLLATWTRDALSSIMVIAALGLLMTLAGVLINRAIRARSAANRALRDNQARFYQMMYHAPMLVSVKDIDGRVRFINKALEELFGTSWKNATGKQLKDFLSPVTAPAEIISALDQEVVETKIPLQREVSYPSIEGTRTALFVKFPMFDSDGKIESVASFSLDLTQQRRAATWFRTIMDNAPALISLKDINGRFVFVNRTQELATGVSAAAFLGRRSSDLFPIEYAEMHDRFDREVLEARAPIQREFTAPYTVGSRTLLFVKFPVFDARGDIEFIGSIATDVTAQKQAESQLMQAQRMEAVGQLTGGIAHDFNNLLTVMIGNSELLTAALAGDDRLEPLARMTLEAAERSATLTQRLLAFGRRQMLEPRATDIGALVDGMQDLIVRAAGIQSDVDIRYDRDDLWPAIVDPGQLETAILNLVVNSRDAMPTGGSIVLELANVEFDEKYVELNPDAKAGSYVMIAVSDTGTGMPPEVVARVFEPFFTTKEAGKGTGLGLPTIYGFVKQSGGHVKIQSVVGQGTVVRLFIPRAREAGIVPDLPPEMPVKLPRGHESILLVEDDRAVRIHTESQLADFGYRVTSAANPREALRLAHLTGKPDLLVTDIIMAGQTNGRQLAERMRERWPDIKVLYISGYSDGVLPELSDGRADSMHFLAKPFRRHELARKVREVLDSPAETAPFTV